MKSSKILTKVERDKLHITITNYDRRAFPHGNRKDYGTEHYGTIKFPANMGKGMGCNFGENVR